MTAHRLAAAGRSLWLCYRTSRGSAPFIGCMGRSFGDALLRKTQCLSGSHDVERRIDIGFVVVEVEPEAHVSPGLRVPHSCFVEPVECTGLGSVRMVIV